ncbi:MAG: hypothetical protein MRJ66_11730 [Nitrospira sp.]|nr:hypothetical protein [Nitrospira sp.]
MAKRVREDVIGQSWKKPYGQVREITATNILDPFAEFSKIFLFRMCAH